MENNQLKIEYRDTEKLIPYARNARTHSDEQVAQIAGSIKEFGFNNPILVDGENGVIAGHGRLLAARKLGLKQVPVVELAHLSEADKRAYILADNKIALNSGWDEELLGLELGELKDFGISPMDIGFTDEEAAQFAVGGEVGGEEEFESKRTAPGALSERFLIPPFSVFLRRSGAWVDRGRAWKQLGIRSGDGRDENLIYSYTGTVTNALKKEKLEKERGAKISWEEFFKLCPDAEQISNTSIFDPVLCEIVYRWFSASGDSVLDPFAGGSVRGVVAAMCDRQYFGNDLRQEQIDENRKQADEICQDCEFPPVYSCGDSMKINELQKGVEADLLFSCPPYANLEVYSDDPRDISNMKYQDFLNNYREIIKKSCAMLKPDRFACFVVSEVRGKDGNYYGFVADTIRAFEDCGVRFYDDIVLEDNIGSAAYRANGLFTRSRKVAKVHQNCLVFLKGDAKKATEHCGEVELPDLSEFSEGDGEA